VQRKLQTDSRLALFDVIWGMDGLLENTLYCQPGIICIQVALTVMWKALGVYPSVVIGHSGGELGAAVAAGILEFEDALKLLSERSRLVSQLPTGAMLAVKASESVVRQLISNFERQHTGEWIDIAAINSTAEVVVSGTSDAVIAFGNCCKEENHRARPILASHAYHSRAMDPCLVELGVIAGIIKFQKPIAGTTFISATKAKEMKSEDFDERYWQDHLRHTVHFAAALKILATENCDVFIEIGPQPVLSAFAMAELANPSNNLIFCPSMKKNEENVTTLGMAVAKLYVAGCDINWGNWFGSKRSPHMALPCYPFQRVKFWYEQNSEARGSPGLNLTSPRIHPLLGHPVQFPIDQKLFYNKINVNDPSLTYLKDHRVGQRVVMPAAAYLEILLSAATEIFPEMASGPLTVENLLIKAPLDLELTVILHTVITKLPVGEEFQVRIHKQLDKEDGKVVYDWKLQAEGNFRRPHSKLVNGDADLETLKVRLSRVDNVDHIYASNATAGIQLGPEFSRIRKLWTGETELLAEMELPDGSEEYKCHPVVLDGLIQAVAFR